MQDSACDIFTSLIFLRRYNACTCSIQ